MEITSDLQRQAVGILDWSRQKLMEKLPELAPAIYLLIPKESDTPNRLWTDGEHLFYDAKTVISDYLTRKDEVALQILHIVCHGLLGHFGKRRGKNEQLFDAAADMKASALMIQMDKGLFITGRWKTADRKKLLEYDKNSLEVACTAPDTKEKVDCLLGTAQRFRSDDHSGWKRLSDGSGQGSALASAVEAMWRSVAMQVDAAMQNSGKNRYGDHAGDYTEKFYGVEESGVSYSELIRRFCSTHEQQQVDPDSINRVWYHIGMELNGDTPIVEPDELSENVPELNIAVALDTSGSCGGKTMRGFLSELLAILRDAGGPKVEFTLIQCDAEIQSVQTMTREDTVEQIMDGFVVSGFGGTDFRPVFRYIEKENAGADVGRFRGLLYLSDGCGMFPQKPPDYPVIFLFPEEDQDLCCGMTPSWVTRAYIRPDQQLKIEE